MGTSARVEAWKLAWESRDAAAVAALYAPDATHESAVIKEVYPELGRPVLRGRHEIAVYARRGLGRFTELRFEIISVTESGNRAAVEYRRYSNVDTAKPKHVMELIEWRGDLIGAVRVFHFEG